MNLPAKVMYGSSALWSVDKAFDAARQHFLGGLFGANDWLADIILAVSFAIAFGAGWAILHFCLMRLARTCEAKR